MAKKGYPQPAAADGERRHLSHPLRMRALLGYDRELCGEVTAAFVRESSRLLRALRVGVRPCLAADAVRSGAALRLQFVTVSTTAWRICSEDEAEGGTARNR